jgi:SAM-dependent methyltransferase
VPRGRAYDERWQVLAAAGESIHGEADLVASLWAERGGEHPPSILDAGCGTGRVAIELRARGFDVVGVDLDPAMLAAARQKAPDATWIDGDVADVTIGDGVDRPRLFDLVVLAGNVMIFVAPGTEDRVVANLARHLRPGGLVVAGFQLHPGRSSLAIYDSACDRAELVLLERWYTWDRQVFEPDATYAVSLHTKAVR